MLQVGRMVWSVFGWVPLLVIILAALLPLTDCQTYTLKASGKSYLEYHTQWQELDQWGIQFSFRTKRANTFLFHLSFIELEGENFSYELELFLKRGELHVRHIFNNYQEEITVAKGELNQFTTSPHVSVACRLLQGLSSHKTHDL